MLRFSHRETGGPWLQKTMQFTGDTELEAQRKGRRGRGVSVLEMETGPQTAESSDTALALQIWEEKKVHALQLSIREYASTRILLII